MSHPILSSYPFTLADPQSAPKLIRNQQKVGQVSDPALAASITRKSSTQTYFTMRYLVDRPLVADAYRAYAYFRWVDDNLDQGQIAKAERLAFLTRQQEIITRCGQGEWSDGLCPEEQLVVDLIHNDRSEHGGLRIYIDQMMAVMAFDVKRQGRLISQAELDEYTRCLATAVTEALHYFIGHNDFSPQDETRYCAVTGAHITHMLRDMLEDTAVGYYNIPQEYLETHGITHSDLDHEAYKAWVQSEVQLARNYFAAGRNHIKQVENLRCRLAGYAYIARFEVVLDAIEKDNYRLRAAYPERKGKKSGLKMLFAALTQTINMSLPGKRNYRKRSLFT